MRFGWAILCLCCCCARAQVTYTGTTDADAFLATGSPGNPAGSDLTGWNYGAAGMLVVAPPGSLKGEFQSVLKFNVSNAVSLFNSSYGTNGWVVTAITMTLTSNYGTNNAQPLNPIFGAVSGGQFVTEWLADNDWVEGTGNPGRPTMDGVTYDSLPTLLSEAHVPLCTNTYTPPGNNIPVTYPLPLETNLIANVADGGEVTFLMYAGDNQIDYLFNSYNYGRGNQPLLSITAAPAFNLVSGHFTNGAFHLTGTGVANMMYQVQASTNLLAGWQTLGNATADDNGIIQYDDPSATNRLQCFYRLAQ